MLSVVSLKLSYENFGASTFESKLGFDNLVSDLVSGDHVGEELDEAVHRYPECCQGQPQLAEG